MSLQQTYVELLNRALFACDYVVAPRGHKTYELLHERVVINEPNKRLLRTWTQYDTRMQEYHQTEHTLYLSGERRAEVWAQHAKLWGEIANPDGTVNSNYGYLIFHEPSAADGATQWQWAKGQLERDKDTRQAVMHFNQPQHQRLGVKDFPCTMHMQFLLRNGVLHGETFMRSQDLIKGFPYDIAWFSYLLLTMAEELDVEVGPLVHNVGSLHLYARDSQRASEIIDAYNRRV